MKSRQMNRTPQTQTFTLAASQILTVDMPGRWVEIITCTAASLGVGFGQERPQVFYPGKGYPGPQEGFSAFIIQDLSGAGCTVTLTVSDEALAGAGSSLLAAISAVLSTIAGYLLAIRDRLAGAASATDKADTTVAATGGAGTLLFATNAARKVVEIQALETNGGKVYIGSTAAVSATNKRAVLAAGDSWYSDHYTGPVYAVGSDANQKVCGSEE